MRKVVASIRNFGLNKYIEKKVRRKSVHWHKRLFLNSTTEYVRTAYGPMMKANWDDDTFKMCYFGTYGTGLSDLLINMKSKFVFLDIGANQGLYSLIAMQNKKCARVVAFEPVARTFNYLSSNISRSGFTDKVDLVNAAISSDNGFANIMVMAGHSGKASMTGARQSDKAFDKESAETITTINAKKLNEIIGNPDHIVVKVDVEGHEEVVISELVKSAFFQNIKAIFYEVHESWSDKNALKTVLLDSGFTCFRKYGRGTHYDVLAERL